MKRCLLLCAVLAIALSLPAEALRSRCYEENYGSGQCATTCVWYNSQGNIDQYVTYLHGC
jgi:hypothetical protein